MEADAYAGSITTVAVRAMLELAIGDGTSVTVCALPPRRPLTCRRNHHQCYSAISIGKHETGKNNIKQPLSLSHRSRPCQRFDRGAIGLRCRLDYLPNSDQCDLSVRDCTEIRGWGNQRRHAHWPPKRKPYHHVPRCSNITGMCIETIHRSWRARRNCRGGHALGRQFQRGLQVRELLLGWSAPGPVKCSTIANEASAQAAGETSDPPH